MGGVSREAHAGEGQEHAGRVHGDTARREAPYLPLPGRGERRLFLGLPHFGRDALLRQE